MILVADSGSTKTDWFITDGESLVKEFTTSGVNPMVQEKDLVYSHLSEIIDEMDGIQIRNVRYFGAGCSEESNKQIIRDSLGMLLGCSDIYVDNDLMGAAISLFGDSPGIVSILGTGSNCCSYDGRQISDARHGIGYILGDEGSGAYFGKILVRDYLYNRLDEQLSTAIDDRFRLNRDQILERVYKASSPNRFLAGFATILSEHMDNAYVMELVHSGIDDFIHLNIRSYPESEDLHSGFAGSVAYAFRKTIAERMDIAGLKIGSILKKPTDGLKDYYISTGSKTN